MTRIPITPNLRQKLKEQGVSVSNEEARQVSQDALALESIIDAGGFPKPRAEYQFNPNRKWRFDYAWPGERIAVELEGGIWIGRGSNARRCPTCRQPSSHTGRHTSPAGFLNDLDKYNEAAVMGWLVVRVTDRQIKDGRALVMIDRAFTLRRNED